MRFDDRLKTALDQPVGSPSHAIVQWRQLIDILSQHPRHFPEGDVARGLTRIAAIDALVEERPKVATIRSLHDRLRSPPLIMLLAGQSANIAAAAISSARLDDQEWALLIPELPSRARGYLRNRRDLGPMTMAMLDRWRSADFRLPPVTPLQPAKEDILPPPAMTSAHPQTHPQTQTQTQNDPDAALQPSTTGRPVHQIGAIIERIETLRRRRESIEAPQLPLEGGEDTGVDEPLERFAFTTDDSGTLIDTEEAPRGALVGISIAEPAFEDLPGPDAYAAAAFNQRMPIENGRIRLLGSEAVEGDWRITARPIFDADSGRFRGYKGEMRRPTTAEDAVIDSLPTDRAEQLQQLLHELRTPLGAIIGFGEIIEQQLFGPVSTDYRELASSILDDARRLLSGFDDLSLAARLDSGRIEPGEGVTAAEWLFDRIGQRLAAVTDVRGVELNLRKAEPMRPFALAPAEAERLYTRLISAALLAAERGEQLEGRLRTIVGVRPVNDFRLQLPRALKDAGEDKLLEAGSEQPGETEGQAPLLGLGFSLRLVRNLARNAGGDLRFLNGDLLLQLPATQTSGAAQH